MPRHQSLCDKHKNPGKTGHFLAIAAVPVMLLGCAVDVDLAGGDSYGDPASQPPAGHLVLDEKSAGQAGSSPVESSEFSHVGQAAVDALNQNHAAERYSTWNLRADSGFDTDWIQQTPNVGHWGNPEPDSPNWDCRRADYDADFCVQTCTEDSDCTDGGTCSAVQATVTAEGETARRLCVGHGDAIYEQIYLGIIAARDFVDITSLSPPTDRFAVAVRNALTFLSNTGSDITVRLLYGNIFPSSVDTDAELDYAVKLFRADSPMKVFVGSFRKGFTSWNHAKIVAVDGEWLLTGGQNLWDQDYLRHAPVHDISIAVRGNVAADAHMFANTLWDYTCDARWWESKVKRSAFPVGTDDCPPAYEPAPGQWDIGTSGAPTIALGRLGKVGANPADDAIFAALDSATSSIKMSLQDIGPIRVGPIKVGKWPDRVLETLGRALLKGVDVKIVLSNLGSKPGGKSGPLGYANGWTPKDVVDRIYDWLLAHPEESAGVDLQALLCNQLHVANLRFDDQTDIYGDNTGIGNHAKFFIVDDSAFYVGSQNLYPSDLAEFGLLVDHRSQTATMLDEYWRPLWQHSMRTVVGGHPAGCER